LAAVLTEFWGTEAATEAHRFTNDELLRLLRSRRGKQMLDRLLDDLLTTRLLTRPLGRPADILPRQVRQALNDYLLSQVNQLLEREVPPLIDALKIHTIVTRKVDSLELPRLEALLLSIMQDQFKYINLFGALLGFIIGLLNLLILRFLKKNKKIMPHPEPFYNPTVLIYKSPYLPSSFKVLCFFPLSPS